MFIIICLQVVEYDSPAALTSNPKSKFKMMLDAHENSQGKNIIKFMYLWSVI